jgi:hypothetical protein
MRMTILATIAAVVLGVGFANADTQIYRAPAHNYNQNNWMGGQG